MEWPIDVDGVRATDASWNGRLLGCMDDERRQLDVFRLYDVGYVDKRMNGFFLLG